jgi:hypothetical protein
VNIAVVIGVVVFSLCGISIMVATIWDRDISGKQLKAEKDAIERLDKALKTTDDPNEPARWVP